MQVFLKFPENPEKSNDENTFIILEFQGKIESSQEDLDSLELGDITQLNEKNFSVKIGNHIIEGTKTKLNSPIIITENHATENEKERILSVIGVCREKILFNKRPTPIFDAKFKKIKENPADALFKNAKQNK